MQRLATNLTLFCATVGLVLAACMLFCWDANATGYKKFNPGSIGGEARSVGKAKGGDLFYGAAASAVTGFDYTTSDDCLAYYDFSNASARGEDKCAGAGQGGSQDLTVETGTPEYLTASPPWTGGTYLSTDGSTEESIEDAAHDSAFNQGSTGDRSFGCHVKFDDASAASTAQYAGFTEENIGTTNVGWALSREGFSSQFRAYWNAGLKIWAGTSNDLGTSWVFTAITRQAASDFDLYIDGLTEDSSGAFGAQATTPIFFIGNREGQTQGLDVTGCFVWDGVLTAAQMCQICKFGFENQFPAQATCNDCTLP
jgi:hypothetical protein